MFLDTISAGIAVPVIMSRLSSRALVTVRINFPPGSHGPYCRQHCCHHAHCDDKHGVHADAAASGCSPSSRRCTASGGRAALDGRTSLSSSRRQREARTRWLLTCCVGWSWNRAISIPLMATSQHGSWYVRVICHTLKNLCTDTSAEIR